MVQAFNQDGRLPEDFAVSALMLAFITYSRLSHESPALAEDARRMLDHAIRLVKASSGDVASAALRARLLLHRSHDYLTRLGNQREGFRELDRAIALSPQGRLLSLRIPTLLSRGDLDGARCDFEAYVREAHPDSRDMYEHLFAAAAVCAKEGRDADGAAYYARGLEAEARHRYLYGTPRMPPDPRDSESATTLMIRVAHSKYSTDVAAAAADPTRSILRGSDPQPVFSAHP